MATEAPSIAAEGTALGFSNKALAQQEAILAKSFEYNTAMAWFQLGLQVVGKISGR